MISDLALATLSLNAELPGAVWAFAGPTFHATMIDTPDGPVIACEGSESIGDWVADFDVIGPQSVEHPDLGLVHAGFDVTTDECFAAIVTAIGARAVILTGHSKGGAEAEMLAAKLAAKGIGIAKLTTFGTPRWVIIGNTKVPLLLPATLVGVSYRHFKDVVTEVPFPPFDHPSTRPTVEIGSGTFAQMMDAAWMHHMANYIAALPASAAQVTV
jgi:Lipase (class 3)